MPPKNDRQLSLIEHEIVAVTDCRVSHNVGRKKFLDRLLALADDLPDDVFLSLSPETRAWVEEGVEAYNEGNPLPDPKKYAPVPARMKRIQQRKDDHAQHKRLNPVQKAPSLAHLLREFVCRNPNVPLRSILAALHSGGLEVEATAAQPIYSAIRRTLLHAQQLGMLADHVPLIKEKADEYKSFETESKASGTRG